MKREFLVEEVMLERAAGEVAGHVVFIDGIVDAVECVSFRFRSHNDQLTMLTPAENQRAVMIVERALRSVEPAGTMPITCSAEKFSPRDRLAAQPLADSLANPPRTQPAARMDDRTG
jgi:hypothetical protein